MTYRMFAALAALSCVTLSGCTLGRQVTTKRFDFTQNLIPDRNHGSTYTTISETGGPIGPLPFDIVITGDVRDKYDKYHGGVDYAYLTYKATNSANAPVRVRLWAALAADLNNCPPDNTDAPLILDVTIPAKGTVELLKGQGQNVEPLRVVVEALLSRPANSAACVYTQGECSDPNGQITIHRLEVVGRARGSLF